MKEIYRIIITLTVFSIEAVSLLFIAGFYYFGKHPQIPFTDIQILPKWEPIYILILILFLFVMLPVTIWQLTTPKLLLKGKLKRILNAGLTTLVVLSVIFYFFIDEKWMTFLGFVMGAAGLIKPIYDEYTKRGIDKEYNKTIQGFQEQNRTLLEQAEDARDAERLANVKKDSYQKLLSKINLTLERENITKQELIDKLDEKVRTIMLQKYNEPARKLITDRLFEMGFKTTGQGVYILPPVKATFIKPGFNLNKWLKDEILDRLPDDHKYIIKFAMVVDFKKMVFEKKIVVRAKTILENMDAEDILEPSEVVEYLQMKKNISIKDVIEVPNLAFLVEEHLVSAANYKKLIEQNEEIINRIQREMNLPELNTTRLGNVDQEQLSTILQHYVTESDTIAERIIQNAGFWNAFFEDRL